MPRLPESILVAVDFGEASARAVAVGGFIAESCHAAALRLLHAESAEAPVYFTSEQVDALERQRHALQAQAEQFLTRFGRKQTPIPFAAIIDPRPPVDAILHESAGVDLVVMGTHGRQGPKRWWLGSVAERVLREVAAPLLVVRADGDVPVPSVFERAVVHAAAPLTGTRTLQYARALASCFHGEVVDDRHELIEPALARVRATLLVVAMPAPRTAAWLSNYGEPLVRSSRLPILFVPEELQGAAR